MSFPLVPNRGGLVHLLADIGRAADLKSLSQAWPSWTLTPRQLHDLELLTIGGLSPLTGFMTRTQYESVRDQMRLPDGSPWPVPIVLDVHAEAARALGAGVSLALRDPEGRLLAALHVDDVWRPETTSGAGATPFEDAHPYFVGGQVEAVSTPSHFDFRQLRLTPSELRAEMIERGWRRVAAFLTTEPLHRPDVESMRRIVEDNDLRLFIGAIAGPPRFGEVEHFTRIRCCQAAMPFFPPDKVRLGLVPLGTRASGVSALVWQGILASNFGCTHVVVDAHRLARTEGVDDPGALRAAVRTCEQKIGIRTILVGEHVYLREDDQYVPADRIPKGATALRLPERDLRRRLQGGEAVPEWASFPAVIRELRRAYPPRDRQGYTVFFTGLSGSGKSTIANVLVVRLLEIDHRAVRLLDGDVIRLHLTSELGFSKEHRDLNIQRIGFVASEITQCGGGAVCAAIAPYHSARRRARRMIEAVGGFVLVHVSTPLSVCEARDAKGLYAGARAGRIAHFTGVTDPYEVPSDADIVIDTSTTSAEAATEQIVAHLRELGYLADSSSGDTALSAAR